MKRYSFLIVFVAMLLLASCSQELAVTSSDGEGTPVRFSVAAGQMRNTEGVATRSADLSTVNETEITNLWVVQFSSAGAYMKSTYIPTVNSSGVDVVLAAGSSTHVYFLANWGSSILASFSGTETALSTITKTLSTEGDILYSGATLSGKKDLSMTSAMQVLTVPSSGYINISASPITLNYAVARINVTYNVTAPNFVLRWIRVCNIPVMQELCSPAAATTTATYPNSGGVLTSSAVFNTSYTDITSSSGSVTFYAPDNQRGQTTSNTTETQKTGLSGDNPTYIDLVGYSTSATDSRGEIHYRIYPGADAIKDYNVVRGTQYAVTANITGTQLTDARVSEQKLANCYLVAPGQTIYIPVKRANQSDLGTQISDVTNSTLTTSVVWQTANGLVTPAMDNRTGCLKIAASSIPATGGDAVVAVKNNGGITLWSWHVWVTGYDPNATNQTMNSLVWMDRNLGALAACTGSNTFDQCGGLMYQWGRKDPFPGPANASGAEPTIYNGTTTTSITKTAVPTTSAPYYNLSNAVQNPATFYFSASGDNDWYAAGTTAQNNNLWGSTKTVYDPCPAGWKVPANGSWTTAGWTTSTISTGTSYTADATWASGVIAYYPASGDRLTSAGTFSPVGTGGYYWSSIVLSTNAYNLNLDNSGASPSVSSNRGYGLSVRCVKE